MNAPPRPALAEITPPPAELLDNRARESLESLTNGDQAAADRRERPDSTGLALLWAATLPGLLWAVVIVHVAGCLEAGQLIDGRMMTAELPACGNPNCKNPNCKNPLCTCGAQTRDAGEAQQPSRSGPMPAAGVPPANLPDYSRPAADPPATPAESRPDPLTPFRVEQADSNLPSTEVSEPQTPSAALIVPPGNQLPTDNAAAAPAPAHDATATEIAAPAESDGRESSTKESPAQLAERPPLWRRILAIVAALAAAATLLFNRGNAAAIATDPGKANDNGESDDADGSLQASSDETLGSDPRNRSAADAAGGTDDQLAGGAG